MPLIERDQVGSRHPADRIDFTDRPQRIGMIAVHQPVKGPAGPGIRLQVGLLQGADLPHLLAIEHGFRKLRRAQDPREQLQGRCTALRIRQRAQRQAGAIGIEASADDRADIRETARDLVFAQSVRAQSQQALGHRRHAGFFGGVVRGSRRKIHGDIEHRQAAIGDEKNPGAGCGLPEFDRQDRQRLLGRAQQRHDEDRTDDSEHASCHDALLRAAPRGAAPRSAVADRDRRRSAGHQPGTSWPPPAPDRRSPAAVSR